jgi:hypothetical protein
MLPSGLTHLTFGNPGGARATGWPDVPDLWRSFQPATCAAATPGVVPDPVADLDEFPDPTDFSIVSLFATVARLALPRASLAVQQGHVSEAMVLLGKLRGAEIGSKHQRMVLVSICFYKFLTEHMDIKFGLNGECFADIIGEVLNRSGM